MASASYSRPTRVGFEALKSRIVAPVARTSSIACVNRFWERRQFVRSENMPWILFDRRRTAASANPWRQLITPRFLCRLTQKGVLGRTPKPIVKFFRYDLLHQENMTYCPGLRTSLFASSRLKVGTSCCRLGQSRIPTAGHIKPLASGRSSCRNVCTP